MSSGRAPRTECRVAAQAICRGWQEWKVLGVAGSAAKDGNAHVVVRFGSVLIYLEDRDALDGFIVAARDATRLGDQVFGPVEDCFALTEKAARVRFEHGGPAPEPQPTR